MMKAVRLASGLGLLLTMSIDAFIIPALRHHQNHHHHNQRERGANIIITTLEMGGFGAASSPPKKGGKKVNTKKKDKKKRSPSSASSANNKLKPRKQWDRFISDDLKSSDSIRVAVRVVSSSDGVFSMWYPVGDIKSKDNAHTEAAVIRHRTLIAEHARRLFPAEIIPSDTLEWGYITTAITKITSKHEGDDDDCYEEWTIAGKVEVMPPDIDKLIGFKGLPDLTGFYASLKGSSSSNIAPGTNNASQSQNDYGSMKDKKITGHSPLEVHT